MYILLKCKLTKHNWIIISALIYHLKELYVTYASGNIVRSRVYIVWKTVITVEFHKATYRRKQINLTCISYSKMTYDFHRYIAVVQPILLYLYLSWVSSGKPFDDIHKSTNADIIQGKYI
jgi:hypothetical protein